jgi:hypothetical protein
MNNQNYIQILNIIQKCLVYCLIFSQRASSEKLAYQYVTKFHAVYEKLEDVKFKKYFLETILTINEYKFKVCELIMVNGCSVTKKARNNYDAITTAIEKMVKVRSYFVFACFSQTLNFNH